MQSLTVLIENFRSIENTSIELRPGVNLLIGSNGSGKTNILAGLKFIRDLFRHGAGLALAKSGGPIRNYRRGEKVIRFSLVFDYGERLFLKKRMPFHAAWTVDIAQTGPDGLASVLVERLTISPAETQEPVLRVEISRPANKPPYLIIELADSEVVGRDLFSCFILVAKDSKRVLHDWLRRQISAKLEPLMTDSDQVFLPLLTIFDDTLREAVVRLTDLNEYNILPDVARRAADQLPSAELAPDGNGLAEVIHAIENRSYNRLFARRGVEDSATVLIGPNGRWHFVRPGDAYSRRLQSLQRSNVSEFDLLMERINAQLSLAVRPLTGVSTQIDPTNGRRFMVFRAEEDVFYPDEVSDGTIKWLAILVSVLLPFSRTYLLEEPENFLHPWMQQQLIRLMREQALQSKSTFIVTSHSATVLNASLPEEITIITRAPGGTLATRLSEMKAARELLEASDFGIGDLWVSGMLGGVPAEVEL